MPSSATSSSSIPRISASSRPERLAALLAAAVLAGATRAAAQEARVSGVVVRVGAADSVPVPAAVVLHAISPGFQGPVDSLTAPADGRFRLRAPLDTGATYLVTAHWDGVAYFARPVTAAEAREGAVVIVAVADTSAAQPVSLVTRHLVIGSPEEPGLRQVMEVIGLRNPGPATRSAPDSVGAAYSFPLPAGATDLVGAEGDFSLLSVRLVDGRLEILAPIPPGESRLLVTYHLEGGSSALSLESPVDTVEVYLEEPEARVEGPGIRRLPMEQEGALLAAWGAEGVPAGSAVILRFPGAASPGSRWLLPALVAIVAIGLTVATMRALARGKPVS